MKSRIEIIHVHSGYSDAIDVEVFLANQRKTDGCRIEKVLNIIPLQVHTLQLTDVNGCRKEKAIRLAVRQFHTNSISK